jgi:hypothetical protein
MRNVASIATVAAGLWLAGCGHHGSAPEQPLMNLEYAADSMATGTRATLTSDGEWQLFYLDCTQEKLCQINLSVQLMDQGLLTKLDTAAATRPMGSLLKTSQVLLYTTAHEVDLHFDQGLYKDSTSGALKTVDSVLLTNQPNNLRYHVSVAFPQLADDPDARKALPDSIDVTIRAAWK